jgi:NAD(P)-dependent dehydrogenase (short-subunit alcohol dehydrogenase family)
MADGSCAGRVVIVTGGASGIGRATARTLAREGARVVVADLNLEGARTVAKEIEAAGGEALGCEVDVAEPESNQEMVRASLERFGALHAAHLNAGIAAPSTILDSSLEDWDRVVAVNLRGVFLGLRAVAPPMIEAGGGSIVATASVAGLLGGSGMPSYYASKHGVVGLVKSAAAEFCGHGIRVNALTDDLMGSMHLLNRVGRPEEVAEFVTFLLSERAGFMTGGAYVVDGGMTASVTPPGQSGRLDEIGAGVTD